MKKKNNNLQKYIFIILIIFIVAIVGIIIISQNDDKKNLIIKNVTFNVANNFLEKASDEEKNVWYYFPKKDLSGSSGYLEVIVYDQNEEPESFNDVKELFEDAMSGYDVLNKNEYVNNNNCQILEYDLNYEKEIQYNYYIFKDNKYAVVIGRDYEKTKDSEIAKTAKEIADTFNWKN